MKDKRNKEQLTISLGANMDSSKKFANFKCWKIKEIQMFKECEIVL